MLGLKGVTSAPWSIKTFREKEAFFIVFKNMKNLFSESLVKKEFAVVFASFIVFAYPLGILADDESKKTVDLTLNGQEEVVKTDAGSIKDLLAEMGVSVHSKDYLFPSANTQVKDHQKIVWKQAKQVTIVKDNEKNTIWTTANTVAELLNEQKIVVNKHDQITPGLKKRLKNKMDISIKKARYLTYADGGEQKKVWSTSTTVADFLTQQGIKLGEFDRVEPTLTATISANELINIIRVEKVTDVVEEPLQFAVFTQQDDSLEKGTERTITEGQSGFVSNQYEVTLENGKEVSRTLIDQKVIKDKQDKVVAVGTKDPADQASTANANSGIEYAVNATAYTAYCGGCSGHTATGINLLANPNIKVIAVDPSIIPLGTKVYVEGYGYAVAADTGSAIRGYKIDVFFSSTADALRWGNRRIKIKVLN